MNQPPQNGSHGTMKPFVRIVEQPAKCAIRFRYECEGRSAGSIPGVTSTAENKSFPTIQVCNYRGKAVVVVSCVTKDGPYRPHPHNLVGKEGCKKGVCTIVIDNNAEMTCTFTSLGIQCVKRKDIEDSLKLRELIKVDPFRTGFNHRSQASSIDLNVVRLCFQVFIEGPEKGKFTVQLPPIVSEPIYDKKAMAELVVTKLSHYSAPCTGGKEIILLCDRVAKDDIQVRFYHESAQDAQLLWEAYGEFLPNDVHKQVAISLRTPKYYDESIQQPVTVQIQLRRPSDGCCSLSRSFQMTPRELDPDGLVRKRHKRLKEENYDLLQEYIQLASGAAGGPSGSAQSGAPGTKRSASLSFQAGKPASPKKDLASMLVQQQQQQQQQQASTSQQVGSRSPFVQYGQQQQQGAPTPQPQNIVCTNESSNSPKSQSPSSQFMPIGGQQQQQSQFIYNEMNEPIAYITGSSRPPSQGGGSPSQQMGGSGYPPQTPTSANAYASPNPYQMYQQPLPSPNPSLASYSSGVPSPGSAQPQQGNNNNMYPMNPPLEPNPELPNEVMERFDSLDIDSSELIPDLEFNSNTMLNLMMDTSSGLSLSDSFSDITNGNIPMDSKLMMTKSYNNGETTVQYGNNSFRTITNNSRTKLKLQLGGSNPALISALTNSMNNSNGNNNNGDAENNNSNNNGQPGLDTPTIEMVNSRNWLDETNAGVIIGPNGDVMSVLRVDNNNIQM